MIVSFGSKNTERIWNGERVKNLPLEIQKIGRRKLRMLNNSHDLADLRIPPSNRFEKLKESGFYSIPQTRISRIIKGKRRITADTALRLSSYFGNSAKFRLGLQNDYDLEEEKENRKEILKTIREKRPGNVFESH